MNIIFVDDEPAILEGLENRFRKKRNLWNMTFVSSALQALDILHNHAFDVIVSDMRMPEIDGYELLKQVNQLYPNMIRIVLSGQTEKKQLLDSLNVAHRVLSKPCTAEKMEHAIMQARSLQKVLKNKKAHSVIANIKKLPTIPKLYQNIICLLNEEDPNLDEIISALEQEPSITARLLQLVNSSFYSLNRDIISVRDAVNYLGMDILPSIILSEKLFETLSSDTLVTGLSLKKFQKHSLLVARIAQQIMGKHEDAAVAFSGAILHDIGHLIIAIAMPEKFTASYHFAQEKKITPHHAEHQLHGFTHSEVGAHLLALWDVPTPIVEVVAHHHHPELVSTQGLNATTAVYLADYFSDTTGTLLGLNKQENELNQAYMKQLGIIDQIDSWQEMANKLSGDNL